MGAFDFENQAKKALGNTGKLPKPSADPKAAYASASKSVATFKKSIGDLQKHVVELQDGYGHYKNTLTQYSDLLDGTNFELDPKKPDDKKKIDTAKDIMNKGLTPMIKEVEGYVTMLNNLDKIITNLRRLEQNRP